MDTQTKEEMAVAAVRIVGTLAIILAVSVVRKKFKKE